VVRSPVVPQNDLRLPAIGRVTGSYRFDPATQEDAPHRRPVDWLSLETWDLPETEGLRTTVVQLSEVQNLIETELEAFRLTLDGLLRVALAEDQKTFIQTLSLLRDLDGSNSPDTRHLTYQQLFSAATALTALIEEFQNLFGDWTKDVEIRF
jgi:hypothetical protein